MRCSQILKVNGNRIASLPHQVVCWSKLVELRMNENGLVQLPETLGMLTSLQHVGFAKNSIDSFPSEVQPRRPPPIFREHDQRHGTCSDILRHSLTYLAALAFSPLTWLLAREPCKQSYSRSPFDCTAHVQTSSISRWNLVLHLSFFHQIRC